MLQKLRDQTSGIGFRVLVFLLIVVLAFFGFGATGMLSGGDPQVATVGDFEITESLLNIETERERAQVLAQAGEDFDPNDLDRLELQRFALAQIINRQVMVQTAANLNVEVAPRFVDEQLRSNAAFQLDGSFDPTTYRQRIGMLGYTTQTFRERMDEDYSVDELRRGVIDSALVTDQEVRYVASLLNQRRDVAYLELKLDEYAQKATVSEDEISDRYFENEAKYVTELAVDVEYIALSVDAAIAQVTTDPSDEQLQAAYADDQAAAAINEQRDSAHILIAVNDDRDLVSARAFAAELKSRLAAGEAFATLAQEYSDDPGSAQQGGSLGPAAKGVFEAAFEDALWSLVEVDEVSAPIETSFGIHLIQLKEIIVSEYPSFESVREELVLRLKRDEALEIYADRMVALERSAYDEQIALTQTAEAVDVALARADRISETSATQTLPAVLQSSLVLETIFSDEVMAGDNSELIEINDETAVVVRIAETHLPQQIPLEDVRTDIEIELRRERAMDAMEAARAEVMAALLDGEAVDEVASGIGASWVNQEQISRNLGSPDAPEAVIRKAFELPRPSSVDKSLGYTETPDGVAIVAVTKATPGETALLPEAVLTQLKSGMVERSQRVEYEAFAYSAEQDLNVERPQL